MIEKFGGRKFIAFIGLSIMAFIFVALGKMDVKTWSDFEIFIGGIYVIGNVGSKVATNK